MNEFTIDLVYKLLPDAKDVRFLDRGGQKLVYSIILEDVKYAFKVFLFNRSEIEFNEEMIMHAMLRAQREIETMRLCDSPFLVKVGPLDLTRSVVNGFEVLCYLEEFIEGDPLNKIDRKIFSTKELVKLAKDISNAIDCLWKENKIHRDIKPGNLIRRASNGDFVLIDLGLVFDLQDYSISDSPVGTFLYFSPEQMEFRKRRLLDFRSDLFSLGVVLYEMSTGKHPFRENSISIFDVLGNIQNYAPLMPHEINPNISEELSIVIMRLLAKQPAGRYRSIDLFQRDLKKINTSII